MREKERERAIRQETLAKPRCCVRIESVTIFYRFASGLKVGLSGRFTKKAERESKSVARERERESEERNVIQVVVVGILS